MAKHAAQEPERIEVTAVIVDEDGAEGRPVSFDGEPEIGSGPDDAPEPPASSPFPYPDARKSRRTRRILIALIIVVIVAIVAVVGATAALSMRAGGEATQQAQQDSAVSDRLAIGEAGTDDAAAQVREGGSAPDVAAIIGATADEAIAGVGHGAVNAGETEVDEEDNPIKRIVTVELSDEPADTRTGVPSVYLGLDEEGCCVEASFSAGLSQLGYASMSFADAVNQARVVDEVLASAGIPVAEGAVALPGDPAAYTSYAADGTTVQRESYTFTGTYDADGATRSWHATLSYDYPAGSTTGVSEVVRRITITVDAQ